MDWKRLSECPVCGKDRCVIVPYSRVMIFCYRLNSAYWIKRDGSTQILPKYRQIFKDDLEKKKTLPLFPETEDNYLFDPKNPYYIPDKKGENKLNQTTLKNTNELWTRSFCYQLVEEFLKKLKFKNGKVQKVLVSFNSKEYQDRNYHSYFELVIELNNNTSFVSRFNFTIGKQIGYITLTEELVPDKKVLLYVEDKINTITNDLQISIKIKREKK